MCVCVTRVGHAATSMWTCCALCSVWVYWTHLLTRWSGQAWVCWARVGHMLHTLRPVQVCWACDEHTNWHYFLPTSAFWYARCGKTARVCVSGVDATCDDRNAACRAVLPALRVRLFPEPGNLFSTKAFDTFQGVPVPFDTEDQTGSPNTQIHVQGFGFRI